MARIGKSHRVSLTHPRHSRHPRFFLGLIRTIRGFCFLLLFVSFRVFCGPSLRLGSGFAGM